jgi:cytoskeleton protein RodZ
MSEEQDKSSEEKPETESSSPLGGERLAEARREQQISVLEVAKELHLDEPKVRALERNDFALLGAPVFAKGHLRKYAQLVGVDEDDVFADYYAMTRAESMPPIVGGRRRASQEMSPGPWIAVIVVVIVAAAGYWWFAVWETAPTPEVLQPEQSQPDNIQPEQLQPEQLQPDEIESTVETTIEAEPEVEEEEAVVQSSAPVENEPAPDPDQIQLSLIFSGECWTEISDADGRKLFFNMGRSGQAVELSGKAPISALFGNADNVSVLVNNSDYVLPTPNSVNRTVRVAILSR